MHLFTIMEKMDQDEVSFDEFVPGLVSFCLFTRSELLGFMFDLLDQDKDGFVSKVDIFNYLLQMKQG